MERLRQVEEVRVLEGDERGTHTNTHTHEITVDLTCRDSEWGYKGLCVCVCSFCFLLHVYLHMPNV